MTSLKETAGVFVNPQFVPVNQPKVDQGVNYSNKRGHSCLRGKAAWLLGLEVYNNINNNNIFFMYISSSPTRETPSYSTPLFCLRNSILGLKYHNAVATAVAGKKVANV